MFFFWTTQKASHCWSKPYNIFCPHRLLEETQKVKTTEIHRQDRLHNRPANCSKLWFYPPCKWVNCWQASQQSLKAYKHINREHKHSRALWGNRRVKSCVSGVGASANPDEGETKGGENEREDNSFVTEKSRYGYAWRKSISWPPSMSISISLFTPPFMYPFWKSWAKCDNILTCRPVCLL